MFPCLNGLYLSLFTRCHYLLRAPPPPLPQTLPGSSIDFRAALALGSKNLKVMKVSQYHMGGPILKKFVFYRQGIEFSNSKMLEIGEIQLSVHDQGGELTWPGRRIGKFAAHGPRIEKFAARVMYWNWQFAARLMKMGKFAASLMEEPKLEICLAPIDVALDYLNLTARRTCRTRWTRRLRRTRNRRSYTSSLQAATRQFPPQKMSSNGTINF